MSQIILQYRLFRPSVSSTSFKKIILIRTSRHSINSRSTTIGINRFKSASASSSYTQLKSYQEQPEQQQPLYNHPISRPNHFTQSLPSSNQTITHHHSTFDQPTISGGPIDLYQQRVQSGLLKSDDFQISIVNHLQALYESLATYQHRPQQHPSKNQDHKHWFGSLFGNKHDSIDLLPPIPSNLPVGIYLYGSVGTGKSMLMDLFYESLKNLPNHISLPAKRVHFHQFMVDVHKRNHKLQTASIEGGQLAPPDILITIAREISEECKVLCFDEFQVTDIVDAMILKRLFEGLLSQGVVFIMTSNRHPDELYKNGIQRESFLPCIELLKQYNKVVDLNSGTDYRKQIDGLARVFLTPVNSTNRSEFKKIFEALTDEEPIIEDRKLTHWGREIKIPLSTSKVAWFSFDRLCGQALSAADYLEIVKKFNVIFVDQVPQLTLSQRDIARRFILFIDAAYESKTKLFTLSEVPIAEIFSNENATSSSSSMSPEMRAAMDDLGLDLTKVGMSSLFSGEEETFAWARAVSRLNQMGSKRWSAESSVPKPRTSALEQKPGGVGASDLVNAVKDAGDVSELVSH